MTDIKNYGVTSKGWLLQSGANEKRSKTWSKSQALFWRWDQWNKTCHKIWFLSPFHSQIPICLALFLDQIGWNKTCHKLLLLSPSSPFAICLALFWRWNQWNKTCHNSDWMRCHSCLPLIYLHQLSLLNARNSNTNRCKYKTMQIQTTNKNTSTNTKMSQFDWRGCHRCLSWIYPHQLSLSNVEYEEKQLRSCAHVFVHTYL